MVAFLTDSPHAMVFGRNEGPKIAGWEKYVLDAEGWQRLWDEVGDVTGTSWRTEMDIQSTASYIKVQLGAYRAI